jgi:hypothetical protein
VVTSDFKGQAWPVRLSDVDALAIPDVDHPYPLTVDECPCWRTVVDRHPVASIEAQQQVCAGDQRMGNAHVGTEVTSDDHIVAWREHAQ